MPCKAWVGSRFRPHDWEAVPMRERCKRCGILNPWMVPPWMRFWDHVEKTETCWLWKGNKTHDGYWRFSLAHPGYKFDVYAHIYSYFMHCGKLPPAGMEFDHICRVRNCVRIDHLRFLTKAENVRRGVAKEFCCRGHKQIPENRYVHKASGYERCKLCLQSIKEEAKEKRAALGLKRGRPKKVVTTEVVLPSVPE